MHAISTILGIVETDAHLLYKPSRLYNKPFGLYCMHEVVAKRLLIRRDLAQILKTQVMNSVRNAMLSCYLQLSYILIRSVFIPFVATGM